MDESYEDFLITLVLLDEQSVMRALEYVVSDWTSRCNRSTNLNVEFGDLWNFNDHSNHERWASIAKYLVITNYTCFKLGACMSTVWVGSS